LIDESTDSAQKFSILYGIWACHYVGGEVSLQRDAALDFVSEAERHGDAAALCLAHRTLGTTYLTMGEFVVGRQHLERALNFCNPGEHAQHRYQYGHDIGASVLSALQIAEETGERWALAEVQRIRAGLLLAAGRPSEEVEAALLQSLQIADHQQARSWELCTACLRLLQVIYKRFTEGFDSADLRRAEALLELEASASRKSLSQSD